MPETAPTDTDPTLAEVRAELAGMEDEGMRAVNERHGGAHSVNLTALRALAKRLRTRPELSAELWETGSANERLLATQIASPSKLSAEQLDAMLRAAELPKVQDWLLTAVVKRSRHRHALRRAWIADPDPVVASAGWGLTSHVLRKGEEELDVPALLDVIEAQMAAAPERLQWAMNETLATIGIEVPELRERALAIGERLGVLRDYPTPAGCTSPFAPAWIAEMVRRREEG